MLSEEVDRSVPTLKAVARHDAGYETPTGSFKIMLPSSGVCPKERRGREWSSMDWAEECETCWIVQWGFSCTVSVHPEPGHGHQETALILPRHSL